MWVACSLEPLAAPLPLPEMDLWCVSLLLGMVGDGESGLCGYVEEVAHEAGECWVGSVHGSVGEM
eukprot:5268989-Amphidinium_carterae.1